MAFYIDKKIVKIINTKQGIDLIVNYIKDRTFTEDIVEVKKGDDSLLIQICVYINPISEGKKSGYSNIVGIRYDNSNMYVNPISRRTKENGIIKSHENYTKELYEYILHTIPAILRNKKFIKIS